MSPCTYSEFGKGVTKSHVDFSQACQAKVTWLFFPLRTHPQFSRYSFVLGLVATNRKFAIRWCTLAPESRVFFLLFSLFYLILALFFP